MFNVPIMPIQLLAQNGALDHKQSDVLYDTKDHHCHKIF
jgi:hypothetical protein